MPNFEVSPQGGELDALNNFERTGKIRGSDHPLYHEGVKRGERIEGKVADRLAERNRRLKALGAQFSEAVMIAQEYEGKFYFKLYVFNAATGAYAPIHYDNANLSNMDPLNPEIVTAVGAMWIINEWLDYDIGDDHESE